MVGVPSKIMAMNYPNAGQAFEDLDALKHKEARGGFH